MANVIADKIEANCRDGITVEEIERQVIKDLYLEDFDDAAHSYAEYKAQRKLVRGSVPQQSKFLSVQSQHSTIQLCFVMLVLMIKMVRCTQPYCVNKL